MKLPQERQNQARQFLLQQARPLERARYRYHFERGSSGDVLKELEAFQNEDGGFGHGLEPDLRTPASSAVATSVAFQVCREIGAPPDCDVVKHALRYLDQTYDVDRRYWPSITPAVNDAPHAPWWNYGPEREARWREELVNPRAELIGYLFDYPGVFFKEAPDGLLADAEKVLASLPDPLEMHDLQCYGRLVETRNLPEDARERLLARLRTAAPKVVHTEEAQWKGYGLSPLALCPSPESPLASLFREPLEKNLEYEIRRQGEDGAWSPTWSWPGDAWRDAEREWKGWLTLRMLHSLRAYGHLEAHASLSS